MATLSGRRTGIFPPGVGLPLSRETQGRSCSSRAGPFRWGCPGTPGGWPGPPRGSHSGPLRGSQEPHGEMDCRSGERLWRFLENRQGQKAPSWDRQPGDGLVLWQPCQGALQEDWAQLPLGSLEGLQRDCRHRPAQHPHCMRSPAPAQSPPSGGDEQFLGPGTPRQDRNQVKKRAGGSVLWVLGQDSELRGTEPQLQALSESPGCWSGEKRSLEAGHREERARGRPEPAQWDLHVLLVLGSSLLLLPRGGPPPRPRSAGLLGASAHP